MLLLAKYDIYQYLCSAKFNHLNVMKHLSHIYLSFLLLVAVLTGCDNNNPTSKALEGISLNKAKIEVEVNGTYKLKVWYEPEEAEELAPEVIWESSKPKIASVDDNGEVTGKAEGTATITATCGKFIAECNVTVLPEPDPVPVESITLQQTEMELFLNETFQFLVTYSPVESERTAEAIKWSSSDETVVSIDSEGYATALALGTATITAACGSKTATCAVTVASQGIAVTPESLVAPSEGGTFTVQVRTPTAWEAEYSGDWLTVMPISGTSSEEVIINVSHSTSSIQRVASVTFKNEVASAVLTITREGTIASFSVSATSKVQFAPGNLQCLPDDNFNYTASKSQWRFAANQWDYIGKDNEKIQAKMTTWIDLFGWGTSGWNQENKYTWPGTYDNQYTERYGNGKTNISDSQYDWGVFCKIGGDPAGTWRTLTHEEWKYLISERENASSLYSIATVNNVSGLILLPDNWETIADVSFTTQASNYSTNNLSDKQWLQMEGAGAVFLPAAGQRNRQSFSAYNVSSDGNVGYYWSSSYDTLWPEYADTESQEAIMLRFDESNSGKPSISDNYRCRGISVRLVKDVK